MCSGSRELLSDARDLNELRVVAAGDPGLQAEIDQAEHELIARWEHQLLLSRPQWAGDALLCVRAGAGGADAEDFAAVLAGMYRGYARRRRWKLQELEITEGRQGGLRSWTVRVRGPGAYGLLAGEHGSHRVAHHSRFGARGKRQTSHASVEVLPWHAQQASRIDEREIRLDTYAGSSKGGQHANRSHTNVRAVHVPTGISAVSQGRSLEQNRRNALAVLHARVIAHHQQAAAGRSEQTVNAGFGGRARSYVFTPYQMVSDERTGVKVRRLDRVLDGNLDQLTLPLLAWRAAREERGS